jgi:filamentous hemagglutinin family protein
MPDQRARRQAARVRAWRRRRPGLSRLLAWMLAGWFGTSAPVFAQIAAGTLPTGGQVVVGSGQLQQNGNLLLINQSSNRLGLDWQSFNVGSSAIVEFRQPSSSSVALNRVLGNSGSEIYGQLKANGLVFLSNPNGVLFAPGAKVDVGGLVATTLDLSQQDFAAGLYRFNSTGSTAAVTNQGSLRASAGGYLALFGQKVANEGDITVDAGTVMLASGQAATVSISGSGLISAVVTPGAVAGSVGNSGSIVADGGVVRLSAQSAQNIAASLVNNSGIVRANTLVERNGEIWITGDQVSTTGQLSAAAPHGGDAGRIMVLGGMQSGQAQVGGTLDTSAASGQGGFVETSAARVKVADGTLVDRRGSAGQHGTWLIDPVDYTVAASGGDITGSTLSTNLAAGPVTIQSANGSVGTAGDVNINDVVSWSVNRLTLNAFNNININAALNGSGTASLALEYGQGAVATGNTSSYNVRAAVALPGGANFSTKLGSNGTVLNYSVINTLADLQLIDTDATSRAGNYVLGADIDASSTASANGGLGFNPIGVETTATTSTANSFSGRFDGLGHTVSGLTINRTATAVGLFASTFNADIRNLTLSGGSIAGTAYVGPLAGITGGSTSVSGVTSSAAASVTTGSANSIGGLIGRAAGTGSLSNSSTSGNVNAPTNTGSSGGLVGSFAMSGGQSGNAASGIVNGGFYAGGLIGYYDSAFAITDGSFTGASVTGGTYAGGLIGYINTTAAINGASVNNPLTINTVVVSGQHAGGLVARSGGTVSNVLATGNVSGGNSADVGGLIGLATASVSNAMATGTVTSGTSGSLGGLIGRTTGSGTLTNSVATGRVIGPATNSTSVGGLVGNYAQTGAQTGNRADGLVSGGTNTGGLIGYYDSPAAITDGSYTQSSISGGSWVGGLIGYMNSTASISGASANNPMVVAVNVTATGNAGGLAGRTNGPVSNVLATGNIVGGTSSNIGGLIGYAQGTGGLTNSVATGTVSGGNGSAVGGLVGSYALSAAQTGNRADGLVSGTGTYTGGLIGWYNSSAAITDGSYTPASISGGSWVGGLIGYMNSAAAITGASANNPMVVAVNVTATGSAGGLAGRTNGSVSNVQATGTVTGGSGGNVGGLIGSADGTGTLSNSVATGSVTGGNNSGNVGGLVGSFSLSGGQTGNRADGLVGGGSVTGGLIGYYNSSAAITDGSYTQASISGGSWVGGLVGYVNSAAAITGASANNPLVVAVNVTATGSAGGLAGRTNGAVSNVRATGNVVGGNGNIGGLIGYAQGTGGVTDSVATGTVTGGSGSAVGGLIGSYGMSAAQTGNRADGLVSSTGTYTGGLIGWYDSAAAITDGSYTPASISGGTWVGGLVGYMNSTAAITGASANNPLVVATNVTATGSAGGLAGRTNGSVSNVLATGTVTGGSGGNVGGLIGQALGTGSLSNSAATGAVTVAATSGSVGGLVGNFSLSAGASGNHADGNVSGGGNTGGLFGLYGSPAAITDGSFNGATVSGANWVGGLVGYISSSAAITGASANAPISTAANVSSPNGTAGGLAGRTAGTVSFARATGTVSGLTAGGLIGQADGSGGISGSSATGAVTGTAVSNGNVGGLVGYVTAGGITGSTASGTVSGGGETGGLVGNFSSSGTISGATASGSVSNTGTGDVGGLVGYASGSGAITNSSATGSVTAANNADSVGGLGGEIRLTGGIANSSATGPVSGGNYTGGVVGYYNSTTALLTDSNAGVAITYGGSTVSGSSYVGGLVGYSAGSSALTGLRATATVTSTGGVAGGLAGHTAGSVSGASATGNVTGATHVGGLIGEAAITSNTPATITDSQASGNVTSTATSGARYAGGLIGYATGGSIVRGQATGTVSGGSWAGGLIGVYDGSAGSITDSRAEGAVSGAPNAGGLVAYAAGSGTLSGGTALGAVTATGSSGSVGGLAGEMRMTGGVLNSSAAGAVSGGNYTGGVLGYYNSAVALVTDSGAGTAISFTGATVSGAGYVGGIVGYSAGSAALTGLSSAASVSSSNGIAGGLAGHTSGNVSNSLSSGNVSGRSHVGGLIGEAVLLSSNSPTTISGSSASGTVTNTSAGAVTSYVGGLVGYATGGSISGSTASGAVSGGSYAGGLVGYFSNAGDIQNAVATGNVSGAPSAGGLAGYTNGAGSISGSAAFGTVTGTSASTGSVGGLVGEFRQAGGISGSEASGVVSNGSNAGGLVGYSNTAGAITTSLVKSTSISGGSWVGGLLGYGAGSGAITGIAVTLNVSSNDSAGGLAGRTGGPVSGSSATGTVQGSGSLGGLVGEAAGSISNSSASGAVTSSGNGYVGGLVGQMTNGTLTSGTATGNVAGGTYTGGLVGYFNSGGNLVGGTASGQVAGNGTVGGLVGYATGAGGLSDSQASGNVSTSAGTNNGSYFAGGLVGDHRQTQGISNSSASGTVSGGYYAGGLAGYYSSNVALVNDPGNGKTLAYTGTSVSGGQTVGGLVGYLNGTAAITGVTVTATVTGTSNAGGLVGRTAGNVSSSSASGAVSGSNYVGGLVGLLEGSASVSNTSASGAVSNTTTSGRTGGLVGYASGGAISNSNASGTVSGGQYAGGLIGLFDGSGDISNVSASGNVSGTYDVGGLIGYASAAGKLTDALATGSATGTLGTASVGGLVGYFNLAGGMLRNEARGAVSGGYYSGGLVGLYNPSAALSDGTYTGASVTGGTYAGGLFGYSNASAISGLSSSATVSATGNAGGLAGYTQGNVSNSSASGAVSGSAAVGGLIGLAAGSSATLTDVTASGNVTGSASGQTGGLVGQASGPGILRGTASGTVSGSSGDVGGLVGNFSGGNDIRNSSATGNVSGGSNVGGLAGNVSGSGGLYDGLATGRVTGTTSNGNVGGLVGYYSQSDGMARVEARGIVSGGANAGGLVGQYSSSGVLSAGTAKGASVTSTGSAGGLVGSAGSLNVVDSSSIATVTGGSYAGGLVGYSSGTGSISNSIASGNVTGNAYVGGLVGWLDGSNISNSNASGNVLAVADSVVAGGLVGQFGYYYYYNTSATIVGSHATGNVVTDSRTAYVGGLVGQVYYGDISTSTASGNVTALDSSNGGSSGFQTGGLVGSFQGGSISNSQASGTVIGRYYTGGLVGGFSATSILGSTASGAVTGTQYTGGLVGNFYGTTISNSSASGAVTGTAYVGGLAGSTQTNGTTPLSNISATGNVTGGSNSSAVGGLIGTHYGAGIVNGFASGKVVAGSNSGYAGGLVGQASSSTSSATGATINDSAATGEVSGGSVSGGLLGYYSTSSYGGVVNSHASGDVTGGNSAGGLVGQFIGFSLQAPDISNSYATGNVSGSNDVGGLVAQFQGAKGISSSYATGAVLGRGSTGTMRLGGLVGYYYFYVNGTGSTGLNRSYATGSVTLASTATLNSSTNVYGGGLVGYLDGSSNTALALADTYATGAVTIANTTGRLRAGGLVGFANASLARSYASGLLTSTGGVTRAVGGLVGQASSGTVTITNAYWNTSTSGQAGSAGGSGLTTAQMTQASSFSGWDLATDGSGGANGTAVWRIYEGFSAPLLRTFLTPLTLTLADATKIYDGTTSFGNATLNSPGGPVSFPGRILTTALSADVGIYSITATGVYSGQNGYDLTVSGSAQLTITPRPLTLAGVIADKVYDGTRTATVVGTAQPTGLVAGEDLTVNIGQVTAMFDTKDAGINKTVTVSGYTLSDGVHGKASNYSIGSGTNTTASITPAPLTAGGFSAVNRAYDGTTLVQVQASGNSTVSGVIGNDQVTVDLSGVGQGFMADKNVGTAKPVTVTGVALSGADAGNYRVVGIDGVTVSITPKLVTVNSLTAQNRDYNGSRNVTVTTGGAVISGLVANDIVSVQTGSLSGTVATKDVGDGKAVTLSGGVGLRGPDAANYTAQAGALSVNITPATIYMYLNRITGTDRVYDGTDAALVNVLLSGRYGSDDVTLTYNAPTFNDKNVAYTTSGAVTTKTITVTGAQLAGNDRGNYILNTTYYGNTTYGTITPKPLTVTGIDAVDRVYDGTRNITVNVSNATVDTTGVYSGDTVVVSVPTSGTIVGTVASKNVGNNLAVSVDGFGLAGADRGNYTLTGTSGLTVDITPKGLTATYVGRDRVYNGQTGAGVVASSTDIIAGDAVSFYANDYASYYTSFPNSYTSPGVFTGSGAKNVGTGKAITVTYDYLTGSDAGNYTYLNQGFSGGYGTASATVTPKPISSAVFSGGTKVYDGSTDATVTFNRSSSGIVGNDVVTTTQDAVFSGSGGKNVGTGKAIAVSSIVLGGADAFNYTLTSNTSTTTGSITAKPVVFSGITGVDRVYDGTTTVAVNASNVSSSGFVLGDDVAVQQPAGGLSTGTVATKDVGTGKTVTVTGLTLSGADAGNYRIDSAGSGISVNITARPLTVSYVGVDRNYNGGVTAQVVGSSADIVAGDTVTFTQNAVFTGLDARNAGSNKPVSVSNIALNAGNPDSANYSLVNTSATTTASILAKPLTVSYSASGRVYNGLADLSVTVLGASSDLVAGDLVTFSQQAQLHTDGAAGSGKLVDITGITLSGPQAANYALTATTAATTVSIAPRPITVTGIAAIDRAYDGTRTVAINVGNASVNSSSVIAGDDVAVDLPQSGLSTGTVATKDVGQSKAVQVTGLAITGAQASNYTLAGAAGLTVNITPRQLTAVYSAASRVYDGTAVAQISATSAGILAGDVGALGISASGVFSDGKNAGQNKEVTVSGGFLTGAERNNYQLVNVVDTTTASITPKLLTASYLGGSRVYDGGLAAPVSAQVSGIISGDSVAFSQTAVFTDSKNVGNNKPIAISGITLNGSDAGNYQLNGTSATATGAVTPKPITVAGLGAVTPVDRVYDGSTTVSVIVPANVTLVANSADIVAGDDVAIAVPAAGTTTGTMVDKNAGLNKAVTITGLTLSGTEAGNYMVAGAAGVTVNIARRDLTADYSGVTRVYNGLTSVSVLGTSLDIVSGDSLLISGSGVFTGLGAKNAGTGKAIQVTAATLSGSDRNNYNLLNPTGSALGDVTPRVLTATYGSITREYDRTADAAVQASASGIVSGDSLGFTQTAVFSGSNGKDVGTGKSIAISNITLTGADAGNYALSSTSAFTTGTITPRPITLVGLSSVQADSRVYDGTTTVTINLQTSGTVAPAAGSVLGGDDVTVNVPSSGVTTGTVANKNVGNNKPVLTIDGLGLSGADAGNYSLVGASGITVNITPLDISATYSGLSRVYDGTVNAPVQALASGVLGGDSVFINPVAVFTGSGAKNVGSNKPISVTTATLSGADALNYHLVTTTADTTGDITPKLLSVSYAGGTRIYDGTVNAPVIGSLGGLVAGDLVDLSQTAVFTGSGARNVGSNKAVAISDIGLIGADAGNYVITTSTAFTTASITPRPLRIDGLLGVTATDRVYDGSTTVAVTISASGSITPNTQDLIAGDDVSIAAPSSGGTTGTMADKNVGRNKAVTVDGLTLSGADAGNYLVAAATGVTVNITPKALTATYGGVSKVYDGTTLASVLASSAGIVAGDSLSLLALGQFTGSGAKNVGTGKTVAVSGTTLSGADAGNYTLLNPSGSTTADITPKLLVSSWLGGTRVYDGGVSAPVTGTLIGLIGGDTVNLSQTAVFTGSGAKNVGSNKAVSISGITLDGADAGNYLLAGNSASTTASVTPKPISIAGLSGLAAVDRAYDGTTTVAITASGGGSIVPSSSDLIPTDDVTINVPGGSISSATMADKNVGNNKAVVIAGLGLSGADALNYVITGVSGLTVNITPRLVTASWAGVSRVYDGTDVASVLGSSADLIGGDVVSILASGSFTAGKNVGAGKAITFAGGSLSGADAANYSLLNPSGSSSADITPKVLAALFTGTTKVYDGSTVAPVTSTLNGLVSGDAVDVSGSAIFTGTGAKNVGNNKPVAVSGLVLSGADAGNYVLAGTSTSTTASITPRPVTIDGILGLTATDRVYDGSTTVAVVAANNGSITPSSNDFIAGDQVGFNLPGGSITSGTMLDKNVGSNKAVVIDGLTLTGADAGNYRVASIPGLTVNITPRALTATYTGVDKIYDGTATATVLGSSVDVLGGDSVTISGTGVFTGGKGVGADKAISITGGLLAGADAGNYSLQNASGSTSASITPKLLTASYTGGTRAYDGTANAAVTGALDGLISGDAVDLSQVARFIGAGARNVGSGKAIDIADIHLSGADAANYSLASTTASTTGGITPRLVNITGLSGLSAVDRVYDGTTTVAITVNGNSGTPGTSDFLANDDVGLAVAGGGISAGRMLDKNVGTNKAVAVSGITLTGSDAGNYLIASTAGLTVNITPRAVQVAGITAQDRVYDGTTVVGINTASGTLSGALAGDDLVLQGTGATGNMADTHVGSGKTVAVAGTALGGADAGNYVVTSSAPVTVNITPRSLNVAVAASDRVYTGDTNAVITLSDDRVAGDQLTLAAASASYADRNVGSGKTVTVSGLTLGGANAGDYVLANTGGSTTAAITPRPLSITANAQTKVYGDSFVFTGLEFSAPELVGGDTIGFASLASSGALAGAGVAGGPYTITISGAGGGSFNPANYALSYVTGLLTVTPRPLTIASNSLVRYADQDNPASFGFSTNEGGLVNGDRLRSVVQLAPAGSAGAPGGSLFELQPSGAQFEVGSSANYSIRYVSGVLLVLPKPPRIDDIVAGGGGQGPQVLAIQVDQAELERALGELERTNAVVQQRGGYALPLGLRAAVAQAGDISVALAGDSRRITLPALLSLPLISYDPQLRRLIFGATAP